MDGKKDFHINLLNNVKKRKELWDTTSEEYKKMQKKEIAWVEIAIEMGKSEDICRATWKKLRSNFIRYYKLEKRYRYQDDISFIIPHIKTTKSGNAVPIVEISDSENYSSEDESHNDVSFNDENSISSSHNRRSITTTTGIHQEVVCEPEFDMKPNISILPDYPETLFVDGDNPYNDNDDNEANEVNEVNEVNEDNDTNEYIEKNDNNVSSAVQSTSNENVNPRKRKLPIKGKVKGNTNKKVQLSSSASSSVTKDDHPMLLFFKSVLPDVTSLPAHKQRLFRKHVLHVIDCLYADVPNPE